MRLALFDLDHTLIPFDSGIAWTRYLVDRGVLEPGTVDRYLDHCRRYAAGDTGVETLHRALMAPLRRHSGARLQQWLDDFESDIAARLPAASRAVVQRHREAGDLCAVVSATTRLVAQRYARAFGISHVLATEPERRAGRLSGGIDGWPCHGEHKVRRVNDWLAAAGLHLTGFERSWFYADSASDLPLLQAVTDPVAVRPDARLRAHALRHGWTVIDDAVH